MGADDTVEMATRLRTLKSPEELGNGQLEHSLQGDYTSDIGHLVSNQSWLVFSAALTRRVSVTDRRCQKKRPTLRVRHGRVALDNASR